MAGSNARRPTSEDAAAPASSLALPPPLFFSPGSSFELDHDALLCVRGRELIDHLVDRSTLSQTGWGYVVEGSAANPKPGLVARHPGRTLRMCWRPPVRPTEKHYSFKLGYLKSYGAEYGSALLNCSGVCACEPTWLDARATTRDRYKVSLHSVQNIGLAVGRGGRGPAGGVHPEGCCVVSVETHPVSDLPTYNKLNRRRRGSAPLTTPAAPTSAGSGSSKFKVLSFYVGPTTAGKGRLHQQSIVLSEGVNDAVEEQTAHAPHDTRTSAHPPA